MPFSPFSQLLRKTATACVVPIILVVLWEALSRSGIVSPQILPAPTQVLVRWFSYASPTEPFDPVKGGYLVWFFSGELPHDAIATTLRVAVGFAIGAGLALPLGLLMGNFPGVYRLCNPLIQVLRPIPPIAYIPLAILWFGLGNPPAFFLISLGAFFPVLMNTIAGVRTVDAIYIRAARNLGANRLTLFLWVILPAATPHILTGARVGIGVAFICVIVAEMIAVNNGLGFRILEAREYFWSDKIIAGMITIGLLGLVIDTGMSRINSYLLRWHRGLDEE
jgi:NitT/TauT family transport system permease protein